MRHGPFLARLVFANEKACRHLIQSLILNRIDYCIVAFDGLPQRSIIRLQAVINAAARLVL